MGLRARTLSGVGITMLVLFVTLFMGAYLVLTERYTDMEDREASLSAARISGALDAEISRVANTALVWGARDRSHTFMDTRDEGVLSGYLTDAQLARLGVNFVVMLDKSGRTVLARAVDLDLETPAEVPDDLTAAIESMSVLRTPGDPRGSVSGVVELPTGIALVGAHSITSSDMYAPPNGTLVFGRYLDQSESTMLSDSMGLQISIQEPLVPPGHAIRTRAAGALATPRSVWWEPESDTTLSAFVEVTDVLGEPVAVLRADLPRTLRASLQSAIGLAALSLFLVCAVGTATVLSFVDRTVIARLTRLSAQARVIGLSGDASRRVEIAGGDEITELAEGVNGMLASIQAADQELRASRDELEMRVELRTRELYLSDAQHRELIESMADAVFSVGLDGRIALVNEQAVQLTGRSKDELMGMEFADLMVRSSASTIGRYLVRAVDHPGTWTVEAGIRGADGVVPVELRVAPFEDTDGLVSGTQWIARDVTERQRFESQLVYLATHDSLTSIANRRAFESALELEVADALRNDTEGAVLWLDLDDFKDVNDTLGHAAGDEVLVQLSSVLARHIRASNVVARVGGDEFAVLAPRVSRAEAAAAAERVRNALTSYTCLVEGRAIRLGASIGVVMFPEKGSTVPEIMSAADAAMYRAKERGRGTIYVSSREEVPHRLHISRMVWNERISQSLEQDGFVVFAQPILRLSTDSVVRHELLVRMQGQEGQLYPPSDFLPVAERLGLINEIDRWMLREALRVLAADATGLRCVDINLSGKAFSDSEMLRLISGELERAGVNPERLGFEITETAAIAEMSKAQRFVMQLKELGCRLSLDDFGSGFSSFYYLKHLPVDCLKIDGSFVRGLPTSDQDRAMVRGIREMCAGLGIEVLAEGVEQQDVLEAVEELGLDYAQGYLIGRPVPIDESQLLEEGDACA